MCRKMMLPATLTVCLMLIQTASAAPTYTAKINWDFGTVKAGGVTHNIHYKDAHLVVDTLGLIEEDEDEIEIMNGEFYQSTPTIGSHQEGGNLYSRVEIDWDADPVHGATGQTHCGVAFNVWTSTYGPDGARPIVRDLHLTNATCPGIGIVTPQDWAIPKPTPSWQPANSAIWTFRMDYPAITGPVQFTNVSFYKTLAEPALSDLTAVNFPLLSKTFLMSEADFSLNPGGMHSVTVPNVDQPEWIIAYYETNYLDPILSGMAGMDVITELHTWAAGTLVPEPATLSLLAVGGLAVLRRRRK